VDAREDPHRQAELSRGRARAAINRSQSAVGANGHYLIINSGHTYHADALRFSYMVYPRLGDWAITKVGENPTSAAAPAVAETVLDSGFCDEDWSIR